VPPVMTAAAAEASSSRSALWVLLIGNFIIGTGILLPAGLLNELSRDLGVTPATAGLLMLAGGIVVGVMAPLVAAFTSRIDRRVLLTFALALYAAGHAAQALSPSFTPLLILRALTVLGAAIFTPQAAATAGLLVPVEKRAAAIAFIFIGWSSATVAGIPLGTYLASLIGWREVFGLMAAICALSAVMVWSVLKPGLYVTPLNLASWRQAFTNPVILAVLLVTMLSMSGQFTAFSYIAPIMKDAFAGGPREIAVAFAVAGVTGVIGNAIASRIVARVGIDQVIAIAIVGLILGLGLFALSFGNLPVALVGIGLWGLGSFSSNSLQQSRLVALAPSLAAATVALNTSVVYVGQAVGAGAGGWLVAKGISPALAWTACGFTILALLASLAATRLGSRSRAPSISSDKA
jgi:MFS transporter, DHA1 family, inner membrane transport protein